MTNKVVTVAEALKIGRSSDQQVYDFLVGDLNQVINEVCCRLLMQVPIWDE